MVPVSAAVREAAGVSGGDKLTVEIELDTEERKILILPALKKTLDENPKAKKNNQINRGFNRRGKVRVGDISIVMLP